MRNWRSNMHTSKLSTGVVLLYLLCVVIIYQKLQTKLSGYTLSKNFLFNPLGTPLYAKHSEFNHREFGYVIPKVLLPMALDYHIRSREIDVNDTAAAELSNLNGEVESKNQAIRVRFRFCLPRLFLYKFSL